MKSIGKRPYRIDVEDDIARITVFDQLPEEVPLLVTDEFSGWLRRRRSSRTEGFEYSSLTRASEREALDGPVVLTRNHIDGPAPGSKSGRRGNRPEHRVLCVLPHGQDPHIDTVLSHQRW